MNSVHDFTTTDKTSFKRGFVSKEITLVLIILLVSTASFGLGRLSYKESVQKELGVGEVSLESMSASVYKSVQELPLEHIVSKNEASIVGSKNGTKYHYSTCPGAKQISKENLVYFNSIEDARLKGYTPASNCKGLE